jgi:hypothetical protein
MNDSSEGIVMVVSLVHIIIDLLMHISFVALDHIRQRSEVVQIQDVLGKPGVGYYIGAIRVELTEVDLECVAQRTIRSTR